MVKVSSLSRFFFLPIFPNYIYPSLFIVHNSQETFFPRPFPFLLECPNSRAQRTRASNAREPWTLRGKSPPFPALDILAPITALNYLAPATLEACLPVDCGSGFWTVWMG